MREKRGGGGVRQREKRVREEERRGEGGEEEKEEREKTGFKSKRQLPYSKFSGVCYFKVTNFFTVLHLHLTLEATEADPG